jgi:hypothetical protein
MKAEVYDTVNFPAYAVSHFVNGDPLENTKDNLDMIDWDLQLHVDIIQSGNVFVDIIFGDDEYFSNRPAFGLPCMCVEATIYAEKM